MFAVVDVVLFLSGVRIQMFFLFDDVKLNRLTANNPVCIPFFRDSADFPARRAVFLTDLRLPDTYYSTCH